MLKYQCHFITTEVRFIRYMDLTGIVLYGFYYINQKMWFYSKLKSDISPGEGSFYNSVGNCETTKKRVLFPSHLKRENPKFIYEEGHIEGLGGGGSGTCKSQFVS